MALATVSQFMPARFDELQVVVATSGILVEIEVRKKLGPKAVKLPLLSTKLPALKLLSDSFDHCRSFTWFVSQAGSSVHSGSRPTTPRM